MLGFNDMSTHVGHFVSSPREREKRERRDSRRDEREEQVRKRNSYTGSKFFPFGVEPFSEDSKNKLSTLKAIYLFLLFFFNF